VDVEWDYYRRVVGRLLAEGHEGRHVLIKGEQIIGIYETHQQALDVGYARFLSNGFFVHQIQTRERVYRTLAWWRPSRTLTHPSAGTSLAGAGPPHLPGANQRCGDTNVAVHSARGGEAMSEPGYPTIHYTELPPPRPGSGLAVEWEAYRREVGRLLAEGYEGRHVLMKGEAILGIYDTHDQALEAGYVRFLNQPFLVHQIQTRERLYRTRWF
jgi:hypothetical protein